MKTKNGSRVLHQQKEYFEALFEQNPAALVTVDLKGNVVRWNPAAEELFGYTQEQAVGSYLDDLIANDDSIRAEAVGYTALLTSFGAKRVQFVTKRTCSDGTLVDVEAIGVPVVVGDDLAGYIAIYRDITQQNRIEEELRHQKEYYEALFVNSPVAVVTIDPKGKVISWNPSAEELFGYTTTEATGRLLDDLVANDESLRAEAEAYTEIFVKAPNKIAELGRFKFTTKRTRKDGSVVDVEVLGLPVMVGQEAVGFIVIYHDISERMRFEEELQRQKEYYEALFLNTPVAVGTVNRDTEVVSWNPAAEKLFGYTQEEAIGRQIDDLVANHASIRAEAENFSKIAIENGGVRAITKRTRKDGSFVDVELLAVPVFVSGEAIGYIALYFDITELQNARRAAEAANKAKSDFLARMSHELRTPLNAIFGFTRIVRRKGADVLPEKQIDNLNKVLISAEHLLQLINDVLDLSKIEAGRMDIEASKFELEPLMDLCISTSKPLIKHQVILSKEIKEKIPPIFSDYHKVRQILLNLLSNATKFTDEGEISVRASTCGSSLVLSVADTGIGIAAEALDQIFEEFQQVDTSTTREYGGTGLGLSISQRLAQLLGGSLVADSKLGVGSTFTLTIPLQCTGGVET